MTDVQNEMRRTEQNIYFFILCPSVVRMNTNRLKYIFFLDTILILFFFYLLYVNQRHFSDEKENSVQEVNFWERIVSRKFDGSEPSALKLTVTTTNYISLFSLQSKQFYNFHLKFLVLHSYIFQFNKNVLKHTTQNKTGTFSTTFNVLENANTYKKARQIRCICSNRCCLNQKIDLLVKYWD